MTSAIALMFALVVLASHLLAFRMRLPTPMTFAFALAAALLAVVAAGVSGFDRSDEWAALVGRSADLTGRTDIWSQLGGSYWTIRCWVTATARFGFRGSVWKERNRDYWV